jgi:hypothetical protein
MLLSSRLLPQSLADIPRTTIVVAHGGVLRHVTPRDNLRALPQEMTYANPVPPKSIIRPKDLTLLGLLLAHVVACCVSLVFIMKVYYFPGLFAFDTAKLLPAMLATAPALLLTLLFIFSRFSFGYFIGFGFYTIGVGYLWLARFSVLDYDHSLGVVSALLSLLAFLLPALFVTSAVRQRIVLSETALDRILTAILVLSTAVIAAGALYNFNPVGLDKIYEVRATLDLPRPLLYGIGICSNALLPFAFACYFMRGYRWRAAVTLLLLLLFYPIMLTKLALFTPAWLLFLALLAGYFEARIAVVLSLLVVVSIGVVLQTAYAAGVIPYGLSSLYTGPANFRMIGVPSLVLDMYADFFAKHSPTYFCQISFLKPFVSCPYSEPLQVIMARNYFLGGANASLLATEGFASVGLKWAPLPALVCGLVVAVVNRMSAGLPPRFIMVSGGVLLQVLMNVPMTTSMLTNGAAFLFVLWYVTPRATFDRPQSQ